MIILKLLVWVSINLLLAILVICIAAHLTQNSQILNIIPAVVAAVLASVVAVLVKFG